MRCLVLAAFLLATPATASAQDARATLNRALGAVLQADGPAARRLLDSLAPDGLSAGQSDMRACILQRLDPTSPPIEREAGAPFAMKALDAYRLYWRDAVQGPEARAAAEQALTLRLAELLARPDLTDAAVVGAQVVDRIRSEGFHVLGNGRTGLLLDIFIWSKQQTRDITVALPEGAHATRVFLMDDFQSEGWSDWLSCGRTGTGGWAKPEGLYAIASAYPSLENETFAVNFLAHETQHFADNAAWPGLPGHELEYRAKLTELALAQTTLNTTLDAFAANQGDNPADAHSHANKRVLGAMRTKLGLAPDADLKAASAEALREAARQELFADTARRRAAAGTSAPAA